jgi:hypothetical protein
MTETNFGQEQRTPAADRLTASKENTRTFVSWMYPRGPLGGFGDMTDQQLQAMTELLTEDADSQLDQFDPKTAKKLKPVVQNVQAWLEGQTMAEIARTRDKLEGTIAMALSGFAARLANYGSFDEILERAKIRAEQKAALAPELGASALMDEVPLTQSEATLPAGAKGTEEEPQPIDIPLMSEVEVKIEHGDTALEASPSTEDEYRRPAYSAGERRAALQDMMEEAGIYDAVYRRPNGRSKKKRN